MENLVVRGCKDPLSECGLPPWFIDSSFGTCWYKKVSLISVKTELLHFHWNFFSGATVLFQNLTVNGGGGGNVFQLGGTSWVNGGSTPWWSMGFDMEVHGCPPCCPSCPLIRQNPGTLVREVNLFVFGGVLGPFRWFGPFERAGVSLFPQVLFFFFFAPCSVNVR